MTKKIYTKTLPTNEPLIKSFLNNFQNQLLLFTAFFSFSKNRRQNFQNKNYKNVHDTLTKFKLNFKRVRLQFLHIISGNDKQQLV